jgi:hypothetical protein
VGDVETGQATLELDAPQFDPQFVTKPGVQVGQWLVQQQDRGLHRHRAGQRDPLHLAAGQQAGTPLAEVREAHDLEHGDGPAPAFGASHPFHPERERDIVGDCHVRPDRVGLEDHADVSPERRHRDTTGAVEHCPFADRDSATVRRFQTGDAPHGARLAAPGLAEQDHRLPVRDRQVQILDCAVLAIDEVKRLDTNLHWMAPRMCAVGPVK